MVAYNDEYGKHKWFAETADVAVEYARSSNGKQREAAARSPLTPAADLSRLSQDGVVYVRNAVCENPKTPRVRPGRVRVCHPVRRVWRMFERESGE